eukprot:33438-Ditylum_brightwellii.AAC.1
MGMRVDYKHGGKDNRLGYFGWAIETHTELLIQHQGHASGNPDLTKSLCTKSTGALPLLLGPASLVFPKAHPPHTYVHSTG